MRLPCTTSTLRTCCQELVSTGQRDSSVGVRLHHCVCRRTSLALSDTHICAHLGPRAAGMDCPPSPGHMNRRDPDRRRGYPQPGLGDRAHAVAEPDGGGRQVLWPAPRPTQVHVSLTGWGSTRHLQPLAGVHEDAGGRGELGRVPADGLRAGADHGGRGEGAFPIVAQPRGDPAGARFGGADDGGGGDPPLLRGGAGGLGRGQREAGAPPSRARRSTRRY